MTHKGSGFEGDGIKVGKKDGSYDVLGGESELIKMVKDSNNINGESTTKTSRDFFFNNVATNDTYWYHEEKLENAAMDMLIAKARAGAGRVNLMNYWESGSAGDRERIKAIAYKAGCKPQSNDFSMYTTQLSQAGKILGFEFQNAKFGLSTSTLIGLNNMKIEKELNFLERYQVGDLVEDFAKAVMITSYYSWQTDGANLAKVGDSFGKSGTLVENPGTTIDWSKVSKHALERMNERGVTQGMVESWVRNGKALEQAGGAKHLFFSPEGAAVVATDGTVVTTIPASMYDESYKALSESLFGY